MSQEGSLDTITSSYNDACSIISSLGPQVLSWIWEARQFPNSNICQKSNTYYKCILFYLLIKSSIRQLFLFSCAFFFQSINLSALFICPSAWLMMHSAFWSGRPFICLNRYRYQLVRLSKRPLDFSSVNLSTSVAFFSTISLLSQLHMTIPLLFCFLFCDKKGFLVFVFSW